jgi:hypothetical protein
MKITYDYSISSWCRENDKLTSRRVKASQIIAEFERLKVAVPKYLTELLANGARYSYQEFDVLSGAMNELYALDKTVWTRIGKLETAYA